jgi:hypothetical protein
VGYSHHRDPKHADNNWFTKSVVETVVSGKKIGDSLFPRIPGYFGFEDRIEFWNRVWFFNFIPECIGTSDKKYATANVDLIERARRRFEKIIRRERPHIEKVFVFTTKGWGNRPPTDREKRGEICTPLGLGFEDVTWGECTFDDHTVLAFGLRHSLSANKVQMTAAVKKALSIS